MSKKIVVLGTGANGSCIAADLIRAKHDVTIIDPWPRHVETMRREGLHISLPDEELHVQPDAQHICDLCALNRRFDVVLICFKAYDTRWAAELIKPYLGDDAIVVGVQNGMTAGDIAEIVGHEHTIGCVVELSSEMFEPGKIKRNVTRAKTTFRIGALDPSMEPRVPEIEAILKHAGKVSINANIQSLKWMKLITNTMYMGAEAIAGATISELPSIRELALKCGEEALRAGQSLGYSIEPIWGLTQEEIEGSNRFLEMVLDRMTATVGTNIINTVWQDQIKGRYSEVDLINGIVVEENAKRGEPSPANQAIVEITRRIHEGELNADPSNIALALDMAKS